MSGSEPSTLKSILSGQKTQRVSPKDIPLETIQEESAPLVGGKVRVNFLLDLLPHSFYPICPLGLGTLPLSPLSFPSLT